MQFDWEEATIGSVCSRVFSGGTPTSTNARYYGGGIPWLRTKEVNYNKIYATEETISEAGLAASSAKIVPVNSVIVAMYGNGDTAGRAAIAKIPLTTNQACCNLVVDEKKADYRFVYYYLRSRYRALVDLKNGGAQQNLNGQLVKSFPIRLPRLSLQHAIADVFETIDDRIDLLRKANITLESIPQAMFKSWFIDFDPVRAKAEGREPEGMDASRAAMFPAEFEESALGPIPRGYCVKRLGQVLELVYGKALKATNRNDGAVPVYGSGGVTGFHDEALVDHASVIVGRKGTVGSLYWEDRPFFPIDTTFYVRPIAAPLTFCYYAMQRLGLESMNTDAAVPGLNRENAYRRELVVPPELLMTAFDLVAMALRASIAANNRRAETLASLRDALLPRLISGELRLPEVQQQMEDAFA
jgi:type I restriction enzyme, S subunit